MHYQNQQKKKFKIKFQVLLKFAQILPDYMGHSFSKELVVSKKSKKKKIFFLLFLIGKNRHGIGKKKVALFDWEWGQNFAPREGQTNPC